MSTAIPVFANYNNQLPDLKSDAYMLVSADTGAVVFQKNENDRKACSSLVKLMTALVVMKHTEDVNTTVRVNEAALEPLYDYDVHTFGLENGEVISILDLLYIMIVDNANDAAYVLADVSSGSVEAFVGEMNALAASMGCKDTHFTEPAGIDNETQYSSVSDMMRISRAFTENPILAKIGGTGTYTITSSSVKRDENELFSSNDLIYSSEDSYKYAKGTMSGYSNTAKFCNAAYATCDGYTYYCVILGGSTAYEGDGAVAEAKKMFRWAFTNLSMTLVADTSTYISDAPVLMSAQADRVRLYPKNNVMALVPDSVDEASLVYQTRINENIKAPIKKGDVLGVCDIVYADEIIATVELVAGQSLDRSFFRTILYVLKTILKSIIFWGAVGLVLIITLSYVFVNKRRDRRELKRIQNVTKKEPETPRESDFADILAEIDRDESK